MFAHFKGKKMKSCGIELKGSEAVFAVVDVDASSIVSFVPTNTKRIILGHANDANALRIFQRSVQSFLQENAISVVVIKGRPKNGLMSAGAQTFKMEAALQLIEGLKVEFYWGANVTKFLNKEKPTLPDRLLGYQRDAYYSALLHFQKVV